MGSNSSFSARKTALAMTVALFCAWQSPVFAHGSEAHMVPMDKTLQTFGADVQWDDYAQMFTITKDGAFVKVKPGAKTAIVNGKTLKLQVPVVMKNKKAWIADTFINDVFQSGLDQTFQVEKRPHPLNALTADEIKQAVDIVKASADFKPNTRFTQIALAEPEKAKVWDFVLNGTPVDSPRQANVIMLDGKHVIESRVDLKEKKSCAGSRSKTRTAWCCWMTSPPYNRLSMTARNMPMR
jgi:primary-amine oxidase